MFHISLIYILCSTALVLATVTTNNATIFPTTSIPNNVSSNATANVTLTTLSNANVTTATTISNKNATANATMITPTIVNTSPNTLLGQFNAFLENAYSILYHLHLTQSETFNGTLQEQSIQMLSAKLSNISSLIPPNDTNSTSDSSYSTTDFTIISSIDTDTNSTGLDINNNLTNGSISRMNESSSFNATEANNLVGAWSFETLFNDVMETFFDLNMTNGTVNSGSNGSNVTLTNLTRLSDLDAESVNMLKGVFLNTSEIIPTTTQMPNVSLNLTTTTVDPVMNLTTKLTTVAPIPPIMNSTHHSMIETIDKGLASIFKPVSDLFYSLFW